MRCCYNNINPAKFVNNSVRISFIAQIIYVFVYKAKAAN